MNTSIVPPRVKDITGQRFGKLTAVSFDSIRKARTYWLFQCDCGQTKTLNGGNVSSGSTVSCGCYVRSAVTTHGMSKSGIYSSWIGMKARCYKTYNDDYQGYGGRGITVCERWRTSFENFWQDMGDRPEGMSIDRIDNDGDYEPSNCRWADCFTQAGNRRTKSRSGVAGVALTRGGKYNALITVNYKTIYLGTYVERWDAICARKSGELTHW